MKQINLSAPVLRDHLPSKRNAEKELRNFDKKTYYFMWPERKN